MRFRIGKVYGYKKSIATLIIFAAIIATIVFITKSLQAPAIGSVAQIPASKPEVVDPLAKPGIYNGKYVSFPYPAHYKNSPAKLTGQNLEVVSYHFVGITSQQITVGVYPGNLDVDGSINFRQKHPELYIQKSSAKWLEFTKTDGTEDVFFLSNDGKVAVISATGPAEVAANDALLVASGLHWK